MTDDEGYKVSAAASIGQPRSDAEVPSFIQSSSTVICYKGSGPNHTVRNCMAGGVRQPEESGRVQKFGHKQR